MKGVILPRPWLLLLAVCSLSTNAVQVNDTALSRLHQKLLAGNQLVRPVKDLNTPLYISVNFTLFKIKEVSSVDQTFKVSGYLKLLWLDAFMSWNATEYGIERIFVPWKNIWTPKISIYNSADGILQDPGWKDSDPFIIHQGYVVWMPSGMFTTSCEINILNFPFDTQECQIEVYSWMTFTTEIYIMNGSSKVETSYFIANSEWILKDTSIAQHVRHVSGYPDAQTILITFVLERRYQGYMTTILLPLGVISIMAMLVFPLSVESGEKMSLGVTMLLAFSLFQLLISENLPKSSEEIPYIMLYTLALMAMNAASIAMTVLVLHFHHKDPAPRLPKWFRKFIFNFLGKIMCTGSSTNVIQPERNAKLDDLQIEEITEDENVKCTVTKSSSKCENDHGGCMLDMLKEIQKITRRIEAGEEGEMIKGEWKKAAGILDRFFFLVSFIIWFTGTIVVMFILTSG